MPFGRHRFAARCGSSMRFTRLTNGFSKKVDKHRYAVALHFMHYNFGCIHKTLRVTPAMQAGIADHVWSLEEIAACAGGRAGSQEARLVQEASGRDFKLRRYLPLRQLWLRKAYVSPSRSFRIDSEICQPPFRPLAPASAHLPSMAFTATWHHHPRQEPGAVMPHAGICGGGDQQCSSLLRPRGLNPTARDTFLGGKVNPAPSTHPSRHDPCLYLRLWVVSRSDLAQGEAPWPMRPRNIAQFATSLPPRC